MASHRTALLIIRAWIEDGSAEPLRAHVRVTDDVSGNRDEAVTLTTASAVAELVEGWLQRVRSTDPDER